MTTSLAIQWPAAIAAALLRTRRGVRRLVAVGRQLWWFRVSDRGIELRQYQHRTGVLVVSWTDVLALAERRAGEHAAREALRDQALKRADRDRKRATRDAEYSRAGL